MATCEGLRETSHLPFAEKEVRQLKYCELCGCPFLRIIKTDIEIDGETGFQRITVKGPKECTPCRQMISTKLEEDKETLTLRDTRIDEIKKFKRRGAALAPKGSKNVHKRGPRALPTWVVPLVKAFELSGPKGLTSKEVQEISKRATPSHVLMGQLRIAGWGFSVVGKSPKKPGRGKSVNLYSLVSCPYPLASSALVETNP